MEKNSQEGTEILNVLVNDGSRVGAYTHNLHAPAKLTSEMKQLLNVDGCYLKEHLAHTLAR